MTNGPCVRRLWWCIALATSSLPVPLSPRIRMLLFDGAARRMSSKTCCIGCALADDVVEAVALLELLLQGAVLARQAPLLEPLADRQQHLFVLERLRDVVEGALAHRLDGALDRGVGGDHDHHLLGIARADLLQDLHARHARAASGRAAPGRSARARAIRSASSPVRGGDRPEALLAQQRAEDVLEDLFVVDDEDVHARSASRRASVAGRSGSSTTKRQPVPRAVLDPDRAAVLLDDARG